MMATFIRTILLLFVKTIFQKTPSLKHTLSEIYLTVLWSVFNHTVELISEWKLGLPAKRHRSSDSRKSFRPVCKLIVLGLSLFLFFLNSFSPSRMGNRSTRTPIPHIRQRRFSVFQTYLCIIVN